jgi:CBS domain containing-hemolysin-like protein
MLLFVYAEAIPKTIAVRSPHQVALLVLPILEFVVALLRPFVGGLIRLANLQSSGKLTSPGALMEEEIRALTRESAAAGVITTGDAVLVDRSFEFNDRQVGDVMVARDQIRAITAQQSVTEAAARAISFGHRRLLVYGHDLDDVVGVVRLRDVAAAADNNPSAAAATVATEVLRCRPDYLISMLLRDMQRSGQRLAIVTDPDGRTVGLVTIEDLVAELVGEIADDDPTDSAAGH